MKPLILAACLALAAAARGQDDARGFAFERVQARVFGDLGRGWHDQGSEPRNHLGGYLAAPVRVAGRLELCVSFGAHYTYPVFGNEENFGEGHRMGGLELDELYARMAFGEAGWTFFWQAGRLRLRANPDAALLGEYLYRYGAYPLALERPARPWDSLGALAAQVNALRVGWASPAKKWRQEAVLLVDSSRFAHGWDLSLGSNFAAAPVRGVELGGGLLFSRFFSTLKAPAPGQTYVRTDSGVYEREYVSQDTGKADTVRFTIPEQAGVLMARLALEPLVWLGAAAEGKNRLRLFAEASLLGWENHPLFYERRSDRMPFMAGVDWSVFGLLDHLRFQWERLPDGGWSRLYGGFYYGPISAGPIATGSLESWRASLLLSRKLFSHFVLQAVYLDEPVYDLDWGSSTSWLPAVQGRLVSARYRSASLRVEARF